MYCFTVCKQYNTQVAILHFGDSSPTPNPAISLYRFFDRILDHHANPFLFDHGPIRT